MTPLAQSLVARRRALVTLVAPAFIAACSTGAAHAGGGVGVARPAAQQASAPSANASSPTAGAAADRMLVRRATLALDTERPGDVAPRATSLATAMGGYVQSSTEDSDGNVAMTLRVPGSSLEAALDTLARLGHVRSRTVSTDDVTDQVVDLEARLVSLRASRDRLRELQQRTGTVGDLLVVERELTRVQGDIDSLEGRVKLVRGSVALAELSLEARRPVKLGPVSALFVGLGRLVGKLFVIR